MVKGADPTAPAKGLKSRHLWYTKSRSSNGVRNWQLSILNPPTICFYDSDGFTASVLFVFSEADAIH
jgi:hypothetical protein